MFLKRTGGFLIILKKLKNNYISFLNLTICVKKRKVVLKWKFYEIWHLFL